MKLATRMNNAKKAKCVPNKFRVRTKFSKKMELESKELVDEFHAASHEFEQALVSIEIKNLENKMTTLQNKASEIKEHAGHFFDHVRPILEQLEPDLLVDAGIYTDDKVHLLCPNSVCNVCVCVCVCVCVIFVGPLFRCCART